MKKFLMATAFAAFISHTLIFSGQDINQDSLKHSPDLFAVQNKNALKFDASSFLADVTSFTFEHCTTPGRSIEGTMGIIGGAIPIDKRENPHGILFRGGYKIMLDLVPSSKIRYRHILKGFYFKAEIDYANYSVYTTEKFFGELQKYRISKFALFGVFGYQFVFDDFFLINPYIAGGMGRNNLDKIDWSYPYGFTILGTIASTIGIRAGVLF
ncbi:MAG TPA: hypothetical protein VK155_01275 [Bacteroidales bacterium]|nr:hypothetical protein [Bacteroidales bacterium]